MINWKIDIADLVNIGVLIAAGVLGYLLLDRYQQQDSRFAVIETLASNVKHISPGLDVHYTNRLGKDGKTLDLKVYIKNVSDHDIWIGRPALDYRAGSASIESVPMDDVFGFLNMLAPEVDLCIVFSRKAPSPFSETVSLEFQAETLAAYTNTLLLAVSELSDSDAHDSIRQSIENNSVKSYRYEEKIYGSDENPIWESFCSNPR